MSVKKSVGVAACVSLFGCIFAVLFGVISDWESNDTLVFSRVEGQLSGTIDADNGNAPKSEHVVKANAKEAGYYPDIYYPAYLKGYTDEMKHPKNKSSGKKND